ncbi:hypothetical protein OG407_09615 [Streptomyces sp. NBC_01515]|uniref:hypothetical protein n=1 Tax=Streptomyces sp. NBC_01515 TaxID=2903890 RepID=UPI00386F531E
MIVLIDTAAHDAWSLRWEAAVAIGTILLTFVTGGLAWSTRQLAQETAADLQAQWRPLLLPVGEWEERSGRMITYPLGIRYSGNTLRVRIRNSGRGPALRVQAKLEYEGRRAFGPADWSSGALEDGNIKWLRFENALFEDEATLRITYDDLAGRPHSTESIIKRRAAAVLLCDVQVIDGLPSRTTKIGIRIIEKKFVRRGQFEKLARTTDALTKTVNGLNERETDGTDT